MTEIRSKSNSDKYREGWSRIWNKQIVSKDAKPDKACDDCHHKRSEHNSRGICRVWYGDHNTGYGCASEMCDGFTNTEMLKSDKLID